MLIAAALAASMLLAPAAQDTSLAALQRRVAAIAAESGATVGVGVMEIESGRHWSVRGDEPFPMQSVFKLPVAIALLRRVDAGQVRLDSTVDVSAADLRAGYSRIAEEHPNGGVRYTVRELLGRMVTESDNTAADLLLHLAGGPAQVTRTLTGLGVYGVRVDGGEGRLAIRFFGLPEGNESRAVVDSLRARLTPEQQRTRMEAFVRDIRDTATPEGLAHLLVLLWRGRLLGSESTQLLLRLMTDTQSGPNRLRGMLPAGTRVAHRTGSSWVVDGVAAVVNDAGIVTLPNGRHVVVAVLVKRSVRGTDAAERAIALVSRAVYDHYAAAR